MKKLELENLIENTVRRQLNEDNEYVDLISKTKEYKAYKQFLIKLINLLISENKYLNQTFRSEHKIQDSINDLDNIAKSIDKFKSIIDDYKLMLNAKI